MKKVVIFLVVFAFLMTGCSVKKVKELSDAEKFANEYNISDDNPFVYAKYSDIESVLNGTGIIFFANSDDEGCIKVAEYLDSVLKEQNIEKIYYFNPKKIDNKKQYNKLIEYFKEYLKKNKEEEYELNIPIVVSIKDGQIVGYSNYFAEDNQLSEEKLTKKKIKQIKNEYKRIINYEKCTNCN